MNASRHITLLCLLLLMLQIAANTLLLSPAAPNVTMLVVQLLPLLLIAPGLLRGGIRSFQWLCFIILFYFVAGVLGFFSPGPRLLALTQTLLSVVIFCAAIFHIARRAGPRAAPADPEESVNE